MAPPRPPSRLEPAAFPVFSMVWWASPFTGEVLLGYVGGGGSAKTGVNNKIVIVYDNGSQQLDISTGEDVGVAITFNQLSSEEKTQVVVAIGHEIHTYLYENGSAVLDHRLPVRNREGCNVVAMHGTLMAVGCENGTIAFFEYEQFLFEGTGGKHEKAICSLAFCPRAPVVVTGGKDGTTRLWDKRNGNLLATLVCSAHDPEAKRQQSSILVRGVAFGDLDGNVLFTVCSGRRGKAFLAAWELTEKGQYECQARTCVSKCPISSMCMSGDGSYIAMGSVEGDVIIWNTEKWKVQKKFEEVHGLPVTCIAARPLPVLQGEEIPMHAISGSADGHMGFLSLSRKLPRKPRTGRQRTKTPFFTLESLFWTILILVFVAHVVLSSMKRCQGNSWEELPLCILNEVLIAPPTRPGISFVPH